jgi:hypothetical protein
MSKILSMPDALAMASIAIATGATSAAGLDGSTNLIFDAVHNARVV